MANLLAFDGSSVGQVGLAVMPPTGDNHRRLVGIVEGPSGCPQLARQEQIEIFGIAIVVRKAVVQHFQPLPADGAASLGDTFSLPSEDTHCFAIERIVGFQLTHSQGWGWICCLRHRTNLPSITPPCKELPISVRALASHLDVVLLNAVGRRDRNVHDWHAVRRLGKGFHQSSLSCIQN
jgi:hypothetical protein